MIFTNYLQLRPKVEATMSPTHKCDSKHTYQSTITVMQHTIITITFTNDNAYLHHISAIL